MAHDVFISYPSKDKTVADAICAKLEEKKIRCWIAPRDIAAGQNFARSIINAIDSCKVFILVWSNNTNASEHILNEINRAFDQGKPIIPFRIQDVQPTPEMLYYFGRTHWLDALTPPLESHINTLINSVFANLGIDLEEKQDSIPDEKEAASETPAKKEVPDIHDKPLKGERIPVEIQNEEVFSEEIVKPGKNSEGKENTGEKQISEKKELKKGILIAFVAVFLIGIVMIIMQISGAFSGIIPSNQDFTKTPFPPTKEQLQKTNTPQATATATTVPTPTVTPLPDWATEFSEPILSVINEREPNFQDDFTTKKTDWYLTSYPSSCPSSAKIEEGKLILYNKAGCFVFAYLANVPLRNWVFTADVWLGTDINFQIGYNHHLQIQDAGYHWSLYNCKKECIITKEGNFPPPANGQPLHLTFVSLGDQNAIYFNDNPAIYYYDYQSPTTEILYMSSNWENKESAIPVEIDNFKVWDLDKIENLSQLLISQ